METATKPRLLVVDDEPNLRAFYSLELGDEGYDVDVAADAMEALAKLENSKYDVIVLDIRMPGMSGIELLRKILTEDKRQPVILNTSHASYKDDFMTWSAEAYVIKSADLGNLKHAIQNVLAKQQ